MTATERRADERLAKALDAQAAAHQEAADLARRDRRAVWLRLHERHGYRHADLADLTGYGTTTISNELSRARRERISRNP